jgi:teichuronic acid exporter
MKELSLTERTLSGFIWLFLGRGGQALLNILVLAVLARHIPPHDFGVITAAMVVVGFSQIFSEIGIGPALVRMPSMNSRHVAAGFALSITISLAVGALVFLLAPLVARFFRMPELVEIVRALAVLFPITGLSVVNQSLLQREMKFRQVAVVDFVAYALGYGLVGISLALDGWGVWALAIAQLGSSSVKTILLVAVNRTRIRFELHGAECRELLRFGGGFSLSRIASYIALQADNLVVGRLMGPAALGLYGRAYQFLMAPTSLLGTLTDNVLFPAMAAVQSDKQRLGRAYMTATATIVMLTLPLSAMLVVLAPELIAVLLGRGWEAVVAPFQILAAVLVFRVSYKVSSCLIRATGMVYRNAWRQWIYARAVTLGAWLGHFAGLTGVAAGVAAAIVLNYLLMLSLSLRITGIPLSEIVALHARHIVVAVVVGLATLGCRIVVLRFDLPPLLVLVLAAACAFAAVLVLLKTAQRIFGSEGTWLASIARSKVGGRSCG